jgi:hypothetical protein
MAGQGVFSETVDLVNRAPIELSVVFDGQSKVLKPGSNLVPKIVISCAKNQNPIMGTQDPYNPHASGAKYLVGVRGTKDPIEPLTLEEWETHLGMPCREDVQQLFEDKYGTDPKAKLVLLNKGKKTTARSRHDAGSSPTGLSDFSSKAE